MSDAVYTICSDLAAKVNAEVDRLFWLAVKHLEGGHLPSVDKAALAASREILPDGTVQYKYRDTVVVQVVPGVRVDGKFSIKVSSPLANL